MEIKQGVKFERPAAGFFLGRIIDVIDKPGQQVVYNNVAQIVDKVIISWVLGHVDGTPYLNKEGKPFTVGLFAPAKISPKSTLGKALVQILGTLPLVNTTEQLADVLLADGGRVAQLFLVKAENKEDKNDPFTNIQGYAPLTPGQVPPSIPAGFVREKYVVKTVGGQPTYSTPQVAAAAAPQAFNPVPAVAPPGQPQFTQEQIAAFLKFQQSQQAPNTVSLEQPKVNQPF